MKPFRRVAAVAAFGLIAAACGSATGTSQTADTIPADSSAAADSAIVTAAAGDPAVVSTPEDAGTSTEPVAQNDGSTEPTTSQAPVGSATEPPVEPADVPSILSFVAPLVGGGELNAATLAGKPTVFWFWAPN